MITPHANIADTVEASRLACDERAPPGAGPRAAPCCGHGAHELVAESPKMQEVVRLVRRVASSEAATILLLGESGVGKGLVARAMHAASRAAEEPFLHVMCTALPESLLESELFGHEKGAFTDAKAQRKGLLQLAEGGTLFLDEIGDMSAAMQGKLLRFLEDKKFRRVGGTCDIAVDARIVAATNKDLAREVQEGRFRRDLYFRLNVIPLRIPPLRERTADILPLATCFVRHFNTELRANVRGIAADAQAALLGYDWPGNVRELRNAVERAVLLTDGDLVTRRDLPVEIAGAVGAAPLRAAAEPGVTFHLPEGGVVLEHVERDLLRQALARCHGNRTRAARLLGINRDRLRYRIQKFHMEDRPAEQ
ncbi:MAG TPA: sigma-54 dependent transcriptional regulator [Planctomycetota bacterium]|nr:sigma-54 dependent transcriptional regulator [Planctomycetota bacterium]